MSRANTDTDTDTDTTPHECIAPLPPQVTYDVFVLTAWKLAMSQRLCIDDRRGIRAMVLEDSVDLPVVEIHSCSWERYRRDPPEQTRPNPTLRRHERRRQRTFWWLLAASIAVSPSYTAHRQGQKKVLN